MSGHEIAIRPLSILDIDEETWESFLRLAAMYCEYFGFVVQDHLYDGVIQCPPEVEPFLISTRTSAEWPGTVLYGGNVGTVFTLTLTDESIRRLCTIAPLPVSWDAPELPEDFFLLRGDESAFYSSVSHDQYGCLEVTSSEYDVVLSDPNWSLVAQHLAKVE